MVTPPLPGYPVPVTDRSVGEEMFPNIQPDPPLAQLKAITSHPVTSGWWYSSRG